MTGRQYRTRPGRRYPAGARVVTEGTNFSIFSRHATAVELLLYETWDSAVPFQIVRLDPEQNRTYFFWHVFVEGLPQGVHYTWRVDGPDDTAQTGFRFDRDIELLDPWARGVTDDLWIRKPSRTHGTQRKTSMRSIVVSNDYDWEGDQPLNHPLENSIIYELHVGGFTRHPSSRVTHPGTFAGLIEKITYLQELGITDVELMPVMAFDEQDLPQGLRVRGLKNYWGYSSHSFFSPHPGYCVAPRVGAHVREFRDMVKALHRAGIGVILDVVLNHTAEGGADGPTINFKGMANEAVYHLDSSDRRRYRDYTGCGNTLNCNHPLVAQFILQCLEYWVREMHVDGFRFDLASVFVRGEDGNPMSHAPVVWNIEFSDVMADTKLIVEAWDAAGLYQVGAYPGLRSAEWNGRYRDVIRRFMRGDKGLISEVATRLAGSSDLYQASGRLPINSVNFVTCHDGFTLYDLVSYNTKHNEANGEGDRDGMTENFGWNCGHEGPTGDRAVLCLRQRLARNYVAVLLLSQGVPMVLAGDEVLRTQRGNNNAYCQDNEISWFDWNLIEKNKDMLAFVQNMIAFRKRHPCLRRTRFLSGNRTESSRLPDITWHGVRLHEPPWDDPDSQVLAFTLGAITAEEEDLHVMINVSESPVDLALPTVPGRAWCRVIDTWETSPLDFLGLSEQRPVRGQKYRIFPHSVVVLESRPAPGRA